MPKSNAKLTSDAQSPRKLSKRGRETEQRFVKAANAVFWQRGFAGAKIAQIIDEGNLSVGSFYHLFADKSDLLDRAAEQLLEDFHTMIAELDLSRAANGDVFTMLYRLSFAGRLLVRKHRGIYRATTELAQNDFSNFGRMSTISPTVVEAVQKVMAEYADQLSPATDPSHTSHAVQLIAVSGLQTELGMTPLFPQDLEEFARMISRAGCGVLGYTGQTEGPSVTIVATGAQ